MSSGKLFKEIKAPEEPKEPKPLPGFVDFSPEIPPPLESTVALGLAEEPTEGAPSPLQVVEEAVERELGNGTNNGSLSPPSQDHGETVGSPPSDPGVLEPREIPHQTIEVARPLCVEEPKGSEAKITLVRTGGQWTMTVLDGWDILTQKDLNMIRNRVLRVAFRQMSRLRGMQSALGKENITLVDKVS